MPFCTQCGFQATPTDAFCGRCGAPQQPAASWRPPVPPADPLSGLSPRTAAILCYIPTIGWIAAVIVLASRKFKGDHLARFHAFQGLYLFACWLGVNWIVRPIGLLLPHQIIRADHLLEALILGTSIFMMVKSSRNELYVLPVIGELAQRSASEP